MKKLLMMFVLLFATVGSADLLAQNLVSERVDQQTGTLIRESSKETLYTSMGGFFGTSRQFSFSLKRVNGKYTMPCEIMQSQIVRYDKSSSVEMLLDNGQILTLKLLYTGDGVYPYSSGYKFPTELALTSNDVDMLSKHKVQFVRVNYAGGHDEHSLRSSKQQLIQWMMTKMLN